MRNTVQEHASKMTIHFSPAQNRHANRAASSLIACLPLRPANDNGPEPANDVRWQEALRHFAKHGLGAPALAAEWAREAFSSGDVATAHRWLEVCRTLDRRLAERTAKLIGMTG